jgi:hypothetical protein
LRQRTNRKAGATVLRAPERAVVPELSMRPDGTPWHPRTLEAWREFFESPMSSEWLQTDITGLEMVAVLYDEFYKTGNIECMKEIRLQRPCYGLTPLDRTRLQWEFKRGEDAERQRQQAAPQAVKQGADLRKVLKMVSG